MPAKRRVGRSNWTRPKKHRQGKGADGFSDIEESEESFSESATKEVTPSKPTTLRDQITQLGHDFAVFSVAVDEIFSDPGAGSIQKARLALEVFGATLDLVDTLHALE